MSTWQPIETAPKDGTSVLVFVPRKSGNLVASARNPTGTQWWSKGLGALKPIGWMPLPDPPSGDRYELTEAGRAMVSGKGAQ